MVREFGRELSKLFSELLRKKLAIDKVVLNDTELTDQTSIANTFNDYFAKIGNDLAIKCYS